MRTLLPIIVVFGQLVGIAILVIFKVRETPQQEKEMIEREDQAMSKVPDEPRVFARWARKLGPINMEELR